VRTQKRSVCPIATALDVFGDRWTLLVIRDMAAGKRLFKEFGESPEGIATNILSDRLSRLVEGRFATKTHDETTGRDAYALTELGQSLVPVLLTIAKWGLDHLPGTKPMLEQALLSAMPKGSPSMTTSRSHSIQ
jgi:DNA-binding HxlR family transcriptional regulator